uniref:Large subunit GTPase 1 homolog n=1 Tax=Timema shepardi TaxID=629360 RepID=A0A7R9AVP7_TIMSH|nr:unnamed protein product [Timema shepardi]
MEITASLAHLEIKRAQEEGVLCPSNLLHGLFVIGAYDNMDHNYSSTTSESHYHGKAISIFQIPGEGEVGEPRNFTTSISCVDQSNRKVTELPDSYNVVKTVTLPSKKPPDQKDGNVPELQGSGCRSGLLCPRFGQLVENWLIAVALNAVHDAPVQRLRFHARCFAGTALELHTSEIADGYDWGRLNLQSVTEESSFQEFLSTAELAETDFQAEKLNITFVNPKSGVGLLSGDERDSVKKKHDSNIELLGIPRRPPWNANTTPEELQAAEREEFLKWRRQLAQLQEVEGLLLTPYEKNLEFWRQLWRVVERSDVVVQIVDARNPLLFRCKDLERYVLEVSPNKQNLILANKADFLTQSQRDAWASYFSEQGVRIAFFSALEAAEEEKARLEAETSESEDIEKEDSSDDDEKEKNKTNELHQNTRVPTDSSGNDSMEENISKISSQTQKTTLSSDESAQIQPATLDSDPAKPTCVNESNSTLTDKKDKTPSHDQHTYDNKTLNSMGNSSKLLTRSELITFFRTLHTGPKVSQGMTTIGLVGYPNVGKSSTINTLLMNKKVSVSATPGKTKHFQTLFLQQDLLLCDCPGLVMPSFLFTKAEMVVNGILPIDQMRDHVPPVTLVASLIPRHILEDRYGIMLPAPLEGEDPLRPPTAEELLNAYGCKELS